MDDNNNAFREMCNNEEGSNALAELGKLRKQIQRVEEEIKTQGTSGNWDYNRYMHGMLNGLICALATIKDEEPKYFDAPKRFLSKNKDIEMIKELQDFAIWMTGCGYDFTQHEYFNKQRDKLLKGQR